MASTSSQRIKKTSANKKTTDSYDPNYEECDSASDISVSDDEDVYVPSTESSSSSENEGMYLSIYIIIK